MTLLTKGANTPVPATGLDVLIRWEARPGGPAIDASALLIGENGKVGSDADFVFYNQPEAAGGAVRHLAGAVGRQHLAIQPALLSPSVERVVVAASVGQGTFAGVPGVELVVQDSTGAVIARYPVTELATETVLVLGEIYRRAGQWKLRAIGQGYDTGLAGLATDYGVTVDDEPAPPPPAAPVAVAPAASDEESALPVDLRKRISMSKKAVAVTLEKKGLASVRARVALVLDASGSMSRLYSGGTVARVVERMAPVAAQLDADQELDGWIFASNPARLPPLRIPALPEWISTYVKVGKFKKPSLRRAKNQPPPDLHTGLGLGNEEPKVIRDILDFYRAEPPGDPVLVLFFSDGGVYRNREISDLLREASALPIFWQFVGLGRAKYGVLEEFDTLSGRMVDNAGFFSLDDIDQIGDGELYDRILNEFPAWLSAARSAGVIS